MTIELKNKESRLHNCPNCNVGLGDHYLVHKDELHRWQKVVALIQEEIKILMGTK